MYHLIKLNETREPFVLRTTFEGAVIVPLVDAVSAIDYSFNLKRKIMEIDSCISTDNLVASYALDYNARFNPALCTVLTSVDRYLYRDLIKQYDDYMAYCDNTTPTGKSMQFEDALNSFISEPLPCFYRAQWEELDKGMISYYMNVKDAIRDKRTVGKLGKFIRKTCKDLTDADIQKIVGDMTGSNLELCILTDEDDIREAYYDINSSCMGGSKVVVGGIHPSAVYADTPDVAVGYIEGVGRSVLNMIEKTFYSIYGDVSRMVPKLNAAGYTSNNVGLSGCRIRQVEHHGEIIMPYLDGEQEVYENTGDSEFYYVGGGDIHVGCADSVYGRLNGRVCDCCGSSVSEEEMTYVECDDRMVCQNCIENEYVIAFTFRHTQDYVPAGDYDLIFCELSGEYYTDVETLNYHGYVVAEDTGEIIHDCEAIVTEDGYTVEEDYTMMYNVDSAEALPYYKAYNARNVREVGARDETDDCDYICGDTEESVEGFKLALKLDEE